MIDRVQLDLFSWDRIKIGEGFNALAMLDLQAAAAIFERIHFKNGMAIPRP
jgi:hypothetical protein